jgi:oxalate decarboxylase/phosphoglucose isomerase-like protein (cupin superfamily)
MSQAKQVWHFSEIGTDEETKRLMPGFEIQYVITEDTTADNDQSVFGHCVFPPRSQHFPHRHKVASEVVYVIKGRVVNGSVDENGVMTEHECGPGTACFVKTGQIHWTRKPYDEPCEFVFAYYGTPSLHKSGYVDLKDEIPVDNDPVSGVKTLDHVVEKNLL